MIDDYGYMEEGRLGKAYDAGLIKRLAHYAAPYKNTILLCLLFTVLNALLDLSAPYFYKIAIDRYILAAWSELRLIDLPAPEQQALKTSLAEKWVLDKEGTRALIAQEDLKKIDPTLLYTYKQQGRLAEKKYYRIADAAAVSPALLDRFQTRLTLADGSLAVLHQDLSGLPVGELLTLRARDVDGLKRIGLLLLALFLLSFGLSYALYYFLEWTGQRIMQDIRVDLFKHLQNQSIAFFDRHPVGRLVTRLTNDVENCNEMFKVVAVTVFTDFFLLAGILAVLFYLNWRLAIVCLVMLPFIFGAALLFSFVSREMFRELRGKVSKLNVFLQERIGAMRIIQLFVKEEKQMADFAAINAENYQAGMKQVRVFAVFMPAMELIGMFAVALLIWYGGGKVVQNQLSLGALVAFIAYLQMFFRPIRDISEKYNIMQAAMASTERIVEFLDQHEHIPEPVLPRRPAEVRGRLEFRNVSFGYLPDQPVLRNISFEVLPGQMVAIVGATGAGKSTIAGLIERFYDPQEGSILLDGIDLRQWSLSDLHGRIGLVMQDVFIFSGSLLGNIDLGRKEIDSAKVAQAVQEANAAEFIRKLPLGLEHEIGERGANLSAGERQLLSFARALAYDPKVLILDEATSSVDPETERLIQEAIFKISAERTTLVVAHRLATIRKADRILVLHHGQIREQGRHEELMALKGIYYRLNMLKEAEE